MLVSRFLGIPREPSVLLEMVMKAIPAPPFAKAVRFKAFGMDPKRQLGLTRCEWVAPKDKIEAYMRSHKRQGALFHPFASRFVDATNRVRPEPRSVYNPEALFGDQFFNYWDDPNITWNEKAWSHARGKLAKAYSAIRGLKLMDLSDVETAIALAGNLDKASGLPHITSKREAIIAGDRYLARRLRAGRTAPPPALGYYRTQPGKTRLVWCLPCSMIMLEGMIMSPIMSALEYIETPYCLGLTSNSIAARMDELCYEKTQYCLDWSKFDSTLPRRVIHACFDELRKWFVDRRDSVFDVVERYFVTCPIVMPDGYIYKGRKRGIPSGSWFTQLIGSMANQLLTEYISYITGDRIVKGYYLGDDSVLAMGGDPDLVKWGVEAEKIGMRIHPDKQEVSHGKPHFLGHYWDGICPTRPVDESFSRFVCPERYIKHTDRTAYYKYETSRVIALMVDNASFWDIGTEFLGWWLRRPVGAVKHTLVNQGYLNATTVFTSWALSKQHKGDASRYVSGARKSLAMQYLHH
uniref:RNA-dependent RNA polymerase n=1 Tax=Driatsky virus TaxID=2707213 RepID=A0A6H0DI13_9VIRU|nr:MAG: RNA-dependent RNA polymerase [Driatsky virus]